MIECLCNVAEARPGDCIIDYDDDGEWWIYVDTKTWLAYTFYRPWLTPRLTVMDLP
jgi:hypothetical protein